MTYNNSLGNFSFIVLCSYIWNGCNIVPIFDNNSNTEIFFNLKGTVWGLTKCDFSTTFLKPIPSSTSPLTNSILLSSSNDEHIRLKKQFPVYLLLKKTALLLSSNSNIFHPIENKLGSSWYWSSWYWLLRFEIFT